MMKIASERNLVCLEKGNLTIGYLLAGYPKKDSFLDILSSCESAGLDVFEIGYPSKNPVADGEVIKQAHSVVDFDIQNDLDYWRKIRDTVDAPVWIMAYNKDLIESGFYQLIAKNRLADAFVIPDTSFEHRLELLKELNPLGIDILGFVTPEMSIEEQEACFNAFPLIYQQLYSGPTGMSVAATGYQAILDRAKTHKDLHVFAGFGIHSAERASQLLDSGFDGVIIGTAMMSKLSSSKEALISFVKNLKDTVCKGR